MIFGVGMKNPFSPTTPAGSLLPETYLPQHGCMGGCGGITNTGQVMRELVGYGDEDHPQKRAGGFALSQRLLKAIEDDLVQMQSLPLGRAGGRVIAPHKAALLVATINMNFGEAPG
jgi:hypothetical protein